MDEDDKVTEKQDLEQFWEREYQMRKDAIRFIIGAYGKNGLTTKALKEEVSAMYKFLNTGIYE